VWAAAGATDLRFGPLGRLLVLTGSRLREWAEARWDEVDTDAATLTVSTSRMKMKFAHVIPLCPAALEIVQNLPRFAGGDYLFTTTGQRPISGFSKFRKKFDGTLNGAVASFTIHDLRRTTRTNLAAAGVSPFIAELVIGHVQKGVHATYDKFRYNDEKRAALERWATRLLSIVAPEPVRPEPKRARNVVPLRRAAGAR